MKVAKQTGFVLHTRPYRESSLLVEIFARDHGRLTVLAKGARRLKSRQRGMLRPFLLLLLSWSGKGDLPVLTQAEALSRALDLDSQKLWCGFYLNELLLRLLHRYDAHDSLFDHYADSLEALARREQDEIVLRIFELKLLKELGFALNLTTESATGHPVDPDARYHFVPAQGLVRSRDRGTEGDGIITGASLLALANEDFTDPLTLLESKRLMRRVIGHHLGGRPLHSRASYAGNRHNAVERTAEKN